MPNGTATSTRFRLSPRPLLACCTSGGYPRRPPGIGTDSGRDPAMYEHCARFETRTRGWNPPPGGEYRHRTQMLSGTGFGPYNRGWQLPDGNCAGHHARKAAVGQPSIGAPISTPPLQAAPPCPRWRETTKNGLTQCPGQREQGTSLSRIGTFRRCVRHVFGKFLRENRYRLKSQVKKPRDPSQSGLCGLRRDAIPQPPLCPFKEWQYIAHKFWVHCARLLPPPRGALPLRASIRH